MTTRVRFAPSPTGAFHVGNARTALFNWLYARKTGGVFVLRIEDTDAERSEERSETELLSAMMALGLRWDEGPDVGGPFGPYRQSERRDRHEAAIEKLKAAGAVYPCYCSQEELEAERRVQIAAHKPPRYSGKCRDISGAEKAAREKSGVAPALRFRAEGGDVRFMDGVRGEVVFRSGDIGDFIIARSDGSPAFYLSSAVDDLDMRITDVIRGEDHLSNTANQTLIMRALGAEPPRYAHLPIILDSEGKKLSKRTGGVDVAGLLDAGYLPEAVNTAMAMLGWAGVTGKKPETLEEMADKFYLSKISRSSARYDEERLKNINAKALRGMPPEALIDRLNPWLERMGIAVDNFDGDQLRMMTAACAGASKTLADAAGQMAQFARRLEPDEAALAALRGPDAPAVLDAVRAELQKYEALDDTSFKAVVESVALKTGLKGKKLFGPMRAAFTGRIEGPELKTLASVIGPRELERRIGSL